MIIVELLRDQCCKINADLGLPPNLGGVVYFAIMFLRKNYLFLYF